MTTTTVEATSGPPPPPPPAPPVDDRPPRPRGRRAWRVAGAVVAVVTLVWGVLQVVVVLAHDVRTVEATFDGTDLRHVDVHLDSGSLVLVGTDSPSVRVSARVEDGLVATTTSERLEDGRLEVRSSCPAVGSNFCHAAYVVEVPAGVDVVVRLGDAGAVVQGIDGTVDVSADTGGVELRDVQGDVAVSTDTGSIDADGLDSARASFRTDTGAVRATFATAPGTVDASTDTGRVDLVVPDVPGAYRLDVSSRTGSVSTPVRTDPAADRTIAVRTTTGAITVTYAAR